ncbi:hypothetical protein MK805_15770 [Shimazuella sp. AN120528]|uniref:putative amidoligase domain-containing protein n=1 Tax=Shimazuella soli TaxID=1892854 RepID=UPI001F0E7368|nr:hypothetical protein [Shimazuella soli]MCH5586399.1 hypothetical protein [Shimazuella soli]
MRAVTLRDEYEKKQGLSLLDEHGKLSATTQLNEHITLNPAQQVERVADEATKKRVLRAHGILVQDRGFIIRQYIVYVCQTKVLFMYCSKSDGQWLQKRPAQVSYQRVPITADKSKEVQNVQNMSIRAVYALGLDYAVVICGIASGKNIVIRKVNPSPKLSSTMLDAYEKAFKQHKEKSRTTISANELMIGADPEFVMRSQTGNIILASKYFPLRGKVGCDAIWLGQNRSHKPLVEVRPRPSTDPQILVERIYHCLSYAARKVAHIPCSWLAGAMPFSGFPIGGHIHFSGIEPNFEMLRALDNYLTLPLMMVEDQKGISRRPKYGYLGDYRIKNHGGFEYRTPPSWLVSPTLTKGVIAVAKLIILNYRKLTLNPLSNPDLQIAYYKGEKDSFRFWTSLLIQELKDLDDYSQYEKYLDPYFEYLQSGKSWDESRDFRRAWRLPPYREGYKRN